MGSSIKKMSKANNQIDALKTNLNKFSTSVIAAKTSLNAMMKGNGTNAYWQGESAAHWYRDAITSLNKIMDNYRNSYKEFLHFAIVIEKAEIKRKYRGQGKMAIKALLQGADGSKHAKGVKFSDMSKEKLPGTLPNTVSEDAVNDDQTKESYKQYNKLCTELRNLTKVCDSLINNWNDVRTNTTGEMNTSAKKRSQLMNNKKKDIQACLDNLEQNYIGDILFSGK